MMKEIDLMIFDFDGTLVDTGVDLAAAVNYTLRQLGREQKREEEIAAFVGDGVTKLIERSLGNDNLDHYCDAVNIFSSYYRDHLLDNTVLCPGVKEVLDFFQHKQKVILTNKRHNFTLAIARGLDIEKYFLEIIGEGSIPYRKPDKRLVDYLLYKYDGKKEKMVIVGDGMNDINLAKNSGILSCIYLNGLGKRQDLLAAHADFYCENISEINTLFY
jgi:phosphoglycolate phosphatase